MWPLIPIGLGLAALLGGGRRNQTTTPPPVWEPLSFDVPRFGTDPSEQELESVGSQIAQLEADIANAPEYATPEQYAASQANLDELGQVYADMEAAMTPVTTAPPTAEVLFGDDPVMLDLYNTQGTIQSSISPTGVITLDPAKFQDDVNSLRLQDMPIRDIDPVTGESFQDFNNTALMYTNPATAEEEAWNASQNTPAYQQALAEEGYIPEIAGEGGGEGGGSDFQDRYMTMLENLMTMIAQPQQQAQQPRFISRDEAAGEVQPLEAEAGFQQQPGLTANDLLGMLTSLGPGG